MVKYPQHVWIGTTYYCVHGYLCSRPRFHSPFYTCKYFCPEQILFLTNSVIKRLVWISPVLELPADNKDKRDINNTGTNISYYFSIFCGEFDENSDYGMLELENSIVKYSYQKTCPFMLGLSCIPSDYYQGLLSIYQMFYYSKMLIKRGGW